MIKLIVALLELDDFYQQSKLIDFAKGKNQIPKGLKNIYKSKLRDFYGRKGNY